jgi:hypothetical protein
VSDSLKICVVLRVVLDIANKRKKVTLLMHSFMSYVRISSVSVYTVQACLHATLVSASNLPFALTWGVDSTIFYSKIARSGKSNLIVNYH